ncbi:LamG-like jellyroll fold domain-containing protein [Alteromonas gilva]|uniref:Family 43 glycosylhydrolase n=1 Tax=Alteromonas gilva TaxID=2987522 RepID=A0ABT5KZ35_9ALTE|nr:LamG-like jellyroll fold domain-containing protein [Alteromonas gilva]MDC8830025.1 family 43 glycosylhydrolase [Alteromonas gilva]
MQNLFIQTVMKGPQRVLKTSIGIAALTFSFVQPALAAWEIVNGANIQQGRQVYVRGTGYYTDNQIDISATALTNEDLRLVVTSSSHDITNADGITEEGMPYFAVDDVSEAIRITFAMQRARFSYNTALYADFGEPGSPDPTVNGPVSFQNASVHDPSVIKLENGEFYVFGSHLAAAKSTDLVNWQLVAGDGVENSPFFDTYETVAAEGIAWSGGTVGSWAADVIQLADGNYYFYYNHCASPDTGLCDASRSYLGIAVSDNIEGPYENLGLFLRSGHVGDENPGINGQNYNGNIDPNAIDPDVFFDKDGRLWMVYGSYSGGIFVMEMDPQTGFPLPDQGYGTKQMGGFYGSIEGPYMLYSPESDYYYLFTSFGGYEQNDGYNMRISRSRSPNGPFVDAQGQDMIGASGGWSNLEPYGVKLMGGFLFDVNTGEPGTDNGYMAPGHNSAYYDPETGKHFVIFHTRFPDRGEGHEIRVHELFINSDGWLVASPHRYVPIEGDNIVDEFDLLGTYRVINHEKDINREAKVSQYLQLLADGQIGGAFSGSYILGDTNQITLMIDDVGTFEGVLAWQYNDNIDTLVPTFTALGEAGEAFWGTQIPAMSNAEAVAATVGALQVPATASSDIDLPTQGALGATISWSSTNNSVIATNGTLTRPAPGESDTEVTLTATVELNGEIQQVSFTVAVKARSQFNRVALFQFEGDLSDSLNTFGDGISTGSTLNEAGGNIQYTSGESAQGLLLDGATGVRLPDALITNNTYTVSMWLNPSAVTQFTTAFFGAAANDNWISLVPWSWDDNTMLWRGSTAWYDATAGLQIPTNDWSHIAFSIENGNVKLYVNGNLVFNDTGFGDVFTGNNALFSLGVNYWDLPYQGMIDELAIYDDALSQEEIVALDISRLSAAEMVTIAADNLSLGKLTALREDITLPGLGLFTAQITWTSSDESVISSSGEVTRPAEGEPDATVTLTALISINGEQLERQFVATVSSLGPIQPIAEFNFDNSDLSDAQGNFAAGAITGNRIDVAGGTEAYTFGARNVGIVLDGNTGVNLPANLITDNTYSVSVWLNPAALTSFTTAFFGYASLDSWVSLVPRGHDGVAQNTMVWSGTAWYDAGIGSQIPAGTWSHLVYVVNGNNLTVYLNGNEVFVGSGFPDVFSSSGSNGFSIGVNYWDIPFNGVVDELRIYDEAISAEDVQQLSVLD